MRLPDPHRETVAIWGAGREGLTCWRWLRQRWPEAPLQIWDSNPATLQQPPLREDIHLQRLHLPTDAPLPPAHWVIKSPGIPLYQPRIEAARQRGCRFTSGSNLWRIQAKHTAVIGVTGTKGKSTTTALLAHLLRHLGQRVVQAGNMGRPLLDTLDDAADWWVVELSSYQLADLNWTPPTALMLNLQQEHLDWHGSLQRYHRDKLRIFGPDQLRIHPPDHVPGTIPGGRWLAFDSPEGVQLQGDTFTLHDQPLFPASALALPGLHNRVNTCAALTCLHGLGFELQGLDAALRSFRGLPHRLQALGRYRGIDWVNDSIATTPEASLAALQAMGNRPVTLMVGGHDRGLDWRGFIDVASRHPQLRLLALPDSGHRLARQLAGTALGKKTETVEDLSQAVTRAVHLTPPGGVGLLSPGAPSYGLFPNYEARGEAFTRLVQALEENPSAR